MSAGEPLELRLLVGHASPEPDGWRCELTADDELQVTARGWTAREAIDAAISQALAEIEPR